MDKLWKLAVIGLLAFLIWSVTAASADHPGGTVIVDPTDVTNHADVGPGGRLLVNAGNVHATIDDRWKQWWDFLNQQSLDSASLAVITVPTDRELILTDVIIANWDSTDTLVGAITRDSSPPTDPTACVLTAPGVITAKVGPNETESINLTTGIRFGPGGRLCIHSIEGGPMYFSLTGYMNSIPAP